MPTAMIYLRRYELAALNDLTKHKYWMLKAQHMQGN